MGLKYPARLAKRLVALTGTVTLAGASLSVVSSPTASATVSITRATTKCAHATGPFRVSGAVVLAKDNKAFIPYGITVPGLANYNSWQASMAKDHKKITATADSWCANTVRLQVSQDNLIGPLGKSYSSSFMKAINQEVSYAESLHLVVVINDQTETDPKSVASYQLGPTTGTETFWKDIIKKYGNDPQVIFDLFNEPRTCSSPCGDHPPNWGLWHSGGSYAGHNYIGMQELASGLRAAGAHNLFWVEGPNYAASFAGMERAHALLTGPGIVYAFHHPGPSTTQDTAEWYDEFAYLVNTNVAPVVDGEWTNYRGGYCWSDAPKKVPEYLTYLYDHVIGMTAYQLAQGLLTTSNTDLASPTTLTNAKYKTWSCTPIANKKHITNPSNQGAGALIMGWYKAHNS